MSGLKLWAIRTCHERRACPKCGVPKGQRCEKLSSKSFKTAEAQPKRIPRVERKHPHDERWAADLPDGWSVT